MSISSRHARTLSPPLTNFNYSNATTATSHQKLNVVTRLAIEGKSKKGSVGASIKMYLKISLPLDSITPGSTIPLFPEENLKILDSHVHPLDNNSVPYNFSSTTSPLLHKAARALNLPARSSTFYVSPAGSVSSSSANIPPLDDKYTGHILVSGYQVSYVLPKEFPRRDFDSRSRRGATIMQFMAAVDIWVPFLSQPPHAPYLLTIPIPRCLSNHIKLRIFPPGSAASSSLASLSSAEEEGGAWELTSDPHVTRIQSARLSRSHSYNNFADDESSDASTSAGFADGCGIQGTFPSTDRIRIRWARPIKPEQIPEAADGRRRVGIKEVKGDMTCAILAQNKGKSKDRGDPGILMKLEYTATCKGVWFPGVATLLGMDIGLEAEDCDIAWAPGQQLKWTVTGDAGYTGFAVGGPPQPVSRQSSQAVSRQSSADYPPQVYVLPASPNARGAIANGHNHAQTYNGLSTSPSPTPLMSPSPSLLRAPLPAQHVADYSFESTPVTTPTNSVSSLASLMPPSSPERARRPRSSSLNGRYDYTDTDLDMEVDARPPRAPITVHLNMNELQPPPKNAFTFSISGVVLVTRCTPPLTPNSLRSSSRTPSSHSDDEQEQEPTPIPRFRVFYSEKETVSTAVRNEISRASVDVYHSSSNRRGGKTLLTVLQKGSQVTCGAEGVRIVIQPVPSVASPPMARRRDSSEDSTDLTHNRSQITHDLRSFASTSRLRDISMMSTARPQPRRDGPLMIPSVTITVEPLVAGSSAFSNGYAVQVRLPAPSDADTEWLEFGLALRSPEGAISSSTEVVPRKGHAPPQDSPAKSRPPRVDIASASVEGVPVRFQTSAAMKSNANLTAIGLPFEETSGKEWISWVSVHVGHIGGGRVDVVYLVKGQNLDQDLQADDDEKTKKQNVKHKEKTDGRDTLPLDLLLPSFALPVGRMQIDICLQEGSGVSSLDTNFMHQQPTLQGRRLLSYALGEFHYPRVRIHMASTVPPQPRRYAISLRALMSSIWLIPVVAVFVLLVQLRQTTAELQAVKAYGATHTSPTSYSERSLETVTVTTTVLSPSLDLRGTPSSSIILSDLQGILHGISIAEDALPSDAATSVAVTLTTAPTEVTTPTLVPPISVPTNAQHVLATGLALPWAFAFSIPTIQLPHVELPDTSQLPVAARATVKTFLDGMGSIWHLFRKVLHYPLDPP